jgi:hypothetical protein
MTGRTLENLFIPATESSPQVVGDVAAGELALSGESYPENCFEFYRPILDWAASYLARDLGGLILEFRITYLNTSSIKVLMDLLDDMEDAYGKGRPVEVRWYYDRDNHRALDLAEEFKEDLALPFHVIPMDTQA